MEVLSYTTSGAGSPTMDVTIYMDVFRNKENIQVVASAVCTFEYDDGFLKYPPYYASFNLWKDDGFPNAGSWIITPEEANTWRASEEKSRTRTISITFDSHDDTTKARIGYNITVPSGQKALATPGGDNYVELKIPPYIAPTAPTWLNINPNPCLVNAKSLLTWGGAKAGSNGIVNYDVEVQALKTNGDWTEWERLSNAQAGTSYQNVAPANMNIKGQKPYIGIQYRFRVRTSDTQYAVSSWIYKTLDVSFGSPTAPTSYKLSSTRIKKRASVTVSWSGGSGGTGTISKYYVEVRTYNHITSKWSDWSQVYSGNLTSYTYSNANLKNNDLIQFRIRLSNSWGQYTSYLTTSSVTIKSNQMWIKINGTWKEGEVYIKVNDTWRSGTPYIKINNVWKESI